MVDVKTDPSFEEKLTATPTSDRAVFQRLRQLVRETANGLPKCGNLVETLKWGEFSFLTEKPKTGTTLRISKNKSDGYSMYVSCNSNLVDMYRDRFENEFDYVGNREIVLPTDVEENKDAIARHIALALTYHLEQKAAAK